MTDDLSALVPLARAFAKLVVEELHAERGRMISQTESELGPRVHRAAVKRRIERGEGGAAIQGRRHLLTPEALRQELLGGKTPKPPAKAKATPAKAPADESRAAAYQRELLARLGVTR